MSETEKQTMGALVSVLVLVAPGVLLHEAPRFPGSLAGGLLGIAGATLFVLLLVYSLVKRSAWLRVQITKHASLRTFLSFHVYAGVAGALLGILHSGHAYRSPLGIALVAAMLTVVLSGFVGRYYLGHLGAEVRQQQALLGTLRSIYDRIALRLGAAAEISPTAPDVPILGLVDAIADVEYSLTVREAAKRITARWMVVHTVASIVLYGLLLLHIGSGIYYGLRWLP